MTDAEYEEQFKLTQEQKAKIPAIIDKWKSNGVSTYQPTAAELERCKREVKKLYELAGFPPPPDHRIIIVSSPFIVRFTVGFAKGIWHSNKKLDPLAVNIDHLSGGTALETYRAIMAATQKTADDPPESDEDPETDSDIDWSIFCEMYTLTDFAMGIRSREEEANEMVNSSEDAIFEIRNSGGEFTMETEFALWQAMTGTVNDDYEMEAECCEVNGDVSPVLDAFSSALGYTLALKINTDTTRWNRDRIWMDIVCDIARPEWSCPAWDSESFLLRHLGEGRYFDPRFAIWSLKPIRFNFDSQRRPHCDGDAYCEWADGSKLYALNGVPVPRWLAVTPSGQLKAEDYKRIVNADVRVEFLRKFGLDRMRDFGTPIDSYHNYTDPLWVCSEYELIDMSPLFREQEIDYAPHLWMKNLTTGVYHLEAVSPECRTIPDALRFRYGGRDVQLFDVK